MPGGLLNLITKRDDNVILNSNPKKTFFKSVYLKYTNFGLQKFRIDFNGLRTLRMNEPSYFSFKIPRHGDLLMDTYIAINLPNIWSPLYYDSSNNKYIEYQFQWIKNIGTEIIEEIEITCDGQILQKFPGTYINLLSHRDFAAKKNNFDYMTGNRPELYDPANNNNFNGFYPNAVYLPSYGTDGAQPSINSTTLYIPITAWFTFNSQQAIPLVALQYSEIHINIKFRPVKELFTIIDVTAQPDSNNNYPRIQPNFNNIYHQFYRFIQTPPDDTKQDSNQNSFYENKKTEWNADIHLIANYAFLDTNEVKLFTNSPQTYLIKDIYEHKFYDIAQSKMLNLMTSSLVTSWMFILRRSDVKLRNEWTNYTNFDFSTTTLPLLNSTTNPLIKTTGKFYNSSYKEILQTFGIIIDGKYRENTLHSGVFRNTTNFIHSNANFNDIPYVYTYNFCLNTSPFTTQPSGAFNFNNYKNTTLEITTITPPFSNNSSYDIICDDNGDILGINKPINAIYKYTYDLILIEERYNVLNIINGMCGLKYAR